MSGVFLFIIGSYLSYLICNNMTGEQDNTYNFISTIYNITHCDYVAYYKGETDDHGSVAP